MACEATCAAASLAIGEPLAGTAPRASAWLLVEQAGAWGAKALTDSPLDSELGAELDRRAKDTGTKALLVKRPESRLGEATRAFVVSPSPESRFIKELELDRPADLLDLDLAAIARGERTGLGRLVERPVYLVCTNGRRDACCARLGARVARALETARPGRVWECSHLGGHRFAANVVCLPDGICYGRVAADDAALLAEAFERGELVLRNLRGRASLPPPAQAAEAFLREHLELVRTDELRVVASRDLEALLATPGGDRHRVVVRLVEGPARPASCGEEPETSERFELRSIETGLSAAV
jgi:hypothetical protein